MAESITSGSIWKHHSDRIYTVLFLTNTANLNSNYPVTVVYIGTNGNLWSKTKTNFLETMSREDSTK